MPVYFIHSKQITGPRVEITGELAHHLRDVLRYRVGDTLAVVDEHQRRYRLSLDEIDRRRIVGRILHAEERRPSLFPELSLAQALLKKSPMEWVLQKATELGVARFLPTVTERTVVRPSEGRSTRQQDRWARIALEAAQQCGRPDVPEVAPTIDLPGLCESPPKADLRLALWEEERERSLRSVLRLHPPVHSVLILVGPEGGILSKKMELLRSAGFVPVSLGDRILRAETAALAALAVIQYELAV
jgi:16S rRNA (uracil1498-N3)-methyltransferase